jgi:hypothetical protein
MLITGDRRRLGARRHATADRSGSGRLLDQLA